MTQNCLPRVLAGEHNCPQALHTLTASQHMSKTFTPACPVILLTSKLPNICTHIHEYNIQKCSKVI